MPFVVLPVAVQLSLSTILFALSRGARRGWGRRFSAIRLRRLFRARALLFNAGFECPCVPYSLPFPAELAADGGGVVLQSACDFGVPA